MDTRALAVLSLVAGILSTLVAVGMFPQLAAPQLDVPTTSVSGGRIQSAVWSYNPVESTLHGELTVGMSSYAMYIGFGETEFSAADGQYKLDAFRLSVDASGLRLAYPLREDPAGPRYIKTFRCEGPTISYEVWPVILGAVLGGPIGVPGAVSGAILGSQISSFLTQEAYKQAVIQAYNSCKSEPALAPGEYVVERHVYYGAVRKDSPLTLFGFQISTVPLPQPIVYGYAVVASPVYKPVSGGGYPWGDLRVTLSNQRGQSYTATIPLSRLVAEQNASVCGTFPVGGRICYSYFADRGIVLSRGEPYLIRHFMAEDNIPAWSNDLSAYTQWFESERSQLDHYLPANLEIHESAAGIELPQYATYSVDQVFQITENAWKRLSDLANAQGIQFRSLVVKPDHPRVQLYTYAGGLLMVLDENPVDSGRFVIDMYFDFPAKYIGLERLTPSPVIVSVTRDVNVPHDAPASLSLTVRNEGSEGSIVVSLVCHKFTTTPFPQTFEIGRNETRTYTVTFTAIPSDRYKPIDDTCTLVVSDPDRQNVSEEHVVLHYRPELFCYPGTYWCDINHMGYYYCQDPYKPAEYQPYTPCPEGQVCTIDATTGQAKCVPRGGGGGPGPTVVGTYCKGEQICYIYSDGTTECVDCNVGTCVVTTAGATCREPVPPPPPPGKVVVSPEPTDEVARISAGLAAVGFFLLAVILW